MFSVKTINRKTHRRKQAGQRAFLKGLKTVLTTFGTFDPTIFSQRVQEQEATSPAKGPNTSQYKTQEPESYPGFFIERVAQAIQNALDFKKRNPVYRRQKPTPK